MRSLQVQATKNKKILKWVLSGVAIMKKMVYYYNAINIKKRYFYIDIIYCIDDF